MLCEECQVNEAVFSVAVVVGEERTVRHLCPECMARMHADLTGSNVRNLLSSILSAITGVKEEKEEEQPDITCKRCGTTLAQFTKCGKLGCPECYDAFREQLQPMLLQIHGRVQHAGREPLISEAAQRTRSRREELTRQMEQAVALEDFETAAALRDQIRSLKEEVPALES